MMPASRTLWLLVLVAMLSAACGNDNAASTTPTTVTSPTTVTWTTLLSHNAAASRTFTASQAGTVSVTLQSANVPLGIGVGVSSGNAGCRTSTSVTASAGVSPPLTAPVEAGDYCVIVFDLGQIGEPIPFTVQIVYP